MATVQLQTWLTFETTECFRCGVVIAIPADLQRNLLRDHSREFYCINGHAQHYVGKTEAEKLREQLAARDNDLARERARREALSRSNIALKGQVTRTKNRVAAGVCPCCSRSFTALGRHMATKHPDWKSQEIG